jgi:hypothetical protein
MWRTIKMKLRIKMIKIKIMNLYSIKMKNSLMKMNKTQWLMYLQDLLFKKKKMK